MNRDSKRRFLPQLDSLEGRQLLASGGSAGFGHVLLAIRDAAAADANDAPAPSVRIRNQMAVHADRNGVVAKARFPKNRGMQGRPKGNLRRQLPPQFLATQAPAPPPAPLVAPAPTVAAAAPSVAIPPTEQAIIDLTNQQRMLNGLAPLAASGKLVQAAQIHAGNMARLDQMSHVLAGVAQPDLISRAQAVGYTYAKLGENIAYSYRGCSGSRRRLDELGRPQGQHPRPRLHRDRRRRRGQQQGRALLLPGLRQDRLSRPKA